MAKIGPARHLRGESLGAKMSTQQKLDSIIGQIGKVGIIQEVDLLETCCGCERENTYSIVDTDGKSLFKAEQGELQ